MTDRERFEAALAFAMQKHQGQFRIGGAPYISHPIAVAGIVQKWGYGLSYRITALFHDLLEDTDAKPEEILALGGQYVLEAVELLTKHEGYVMAEYIAAIRKNPIAFVVKGADRLHNLQCALCADHDFKRRYIFETIDWYLDFSKEIPPAVKALALSLDQPISELSFLYDSVESWKI